MAEKFIDILMNVNNTEIRQALEAMFNIVGVGKDDTSETTKEIVGDITGDVTGDLTGDVTGDVTGDLTGDVTGDVTGNVTGNVNGNGTLGTLTLDTMTPVNAVAAAAKLTSSGAMQPAVHAVSVLTNDTTDIDDTKIVTIGTTVYRFMTTPAQAYDVLRGTSAANSIANLAAAINASGTGDGSDYFAGTLAHPTAYASASDATTLTVQVLIPGDEQNAAVTESDDAGWTWTGADFANGTVAGVTSAAATLTIGTRVYTVVDELSETNAVAIVDQILYGGDEATLLDNMLVAIDAGATEGTNYSTGTVVNADVESGVNTNTTQIVIALVKGVIGNAIAIECTWANTDWDDEVTNVLGTEVAGVDGTVGSKGQIAWDASYAYVCILANTIADANWEKTPISGTGVLTTDILGNVTGNVTGSASEVPGDVNFSAKLNAAQENITHSTDVTIVFDTEDFDNGSNFNVATGIFTAPDTGIYQLNVGVRLVNVDVDADYVLVVLVTPSKNITIGIIDPGSILSADTDAFMIFNGGATVALTAADECYVYIRSQAGASQVDVHASSGFSGHKIS